MNDKPTLYLETSVVSYLTARPSRDVVTLGHQEITRLWWRNCLFNYETFISQVVLDEAGRGDPQAAQRRLKVLEGFPTLGVSPDVERLAALYMKELQMSDQEARDALHISLASVWAMDYLLTWNCQHIASGRVRRHVREINTREGVFMPTICTPEELLDVNQRQR